jgi:hypothetical protein
MAWPLLQLHCGHVTGSSQWDVGKSEANHFQAWSLKRFQTFLWALSLASHMFQLVEVKMEAAGSMVLLGEPPDPA